jgi:hypothetical protein
MFQCHPANGERVRAGIPATAEQAGARKSADHLAVQGVRSAPVHMTEIEPDDTEDDARSIAKLLLAMILLCLLLRERAR